MSKKSLFTLKYIATTCHLWNGSKRSVTPISMLINVKCKLSEWTRGRGMMEIQYGWVYGAVCLHQALRTRPWSCQLSRWGGGSMVLRSPGDDGNKAATWKQTEGGSHRGPHHHHFQPRSQAKQWRLICQWPVSHSFPPPSQKHHSCWILPPPHPVMVTPGLVCMRPAYSKA